MLDRTPIWDRARGRWRDILLGLGVAESVLNGKAQPCPWCGGRDRFTFDDKAGNGSFVCRHCGAGSGIEFVKRHLGVQFKEAAQRVEALIGSAQVRAPKVWRASTRCAASLN